MFPASLGKQMVVQLSNGDGNEYKNIQKRLFLISRPFYIPCFIAFEHLGFIINCKDLVINSIIYKPQII